MKGWSRQEAIRHFEQIGGSANFGRTSYEGTVFGCSVPLEGGNLQFALDLFGNMLLASKLEHFVERERQVILNEYMERFPTILTAEVLAKRRKLFFEGTRLGTFLRPLGKLETIPIITLDDIRQFYEHCYVPANISIVAVGGLELEQFLETLGNSPFGIETVGNRIQLPVPLKEIQPPAEKRWDMSAADLSNQKFHQSSIELHTALPGVFNYNAVGRAVNTLRTILFREVREKHGWTYGFNISVSRYPEAFELSVTAKFPWEHLGVIENIVNDCIDVAFESTDVIKHHIECSVASYKVNDPNG